MRVRWDFSVLPLREPAAFCLCIPHSKGHNRNLLRYSGVCIPPPSLMHMIEIMIGNLIRQCLPLVQRIEIPKVWWLLVRWQISSWASSLTQLQLTLPLPLHGLYISIICVFILLLFLFLPCPIPPPSIPDHSGYYTCLPQFLLKQHAAVVLVMMVMRNQRLSETSSPCRIQDWGIYLAVKMEWSWL